MVRKYWKLRHWPMAIEAENELDALEQMTRALADCSTRLKAGEKIDDIFSDRVVEIDEDSNTKVTRDRGGPETVPTPKRRMIN